MKKKLSYLFVPLCLSVMTGCSSKSEEFSFAKSDYQIHSGEKVVVEQNYKEVMYTFVNNSLQGINVDSKSGTITYGDNIPDHTQLLYKAIYKEYTCSTVVTLLQNVVAPEIDFISPIDYVSDGDYILVSTSNPNTAITYSLKNKVSGISIDSSTGRVSYSDAVSDNTSFVVSISSNGASKEKMFYAAKNHLAKVIDKNQVIEENGSPAAYILDFSEVDESFAKDVTAVLKGNTFVDSSYYSYSQEKKTLVINSSISDILIPGENTLSIVTPRNIININIIKVTKLIRTPEDLASINDTRESLQGYYVLANDIDLTDYLSKNGEGYNEGKGWKPIGTYNDVTDGTALYYSFGGTFDGNGYTISGFSYRRSDITGYNCGLFGYVNNLAIIKNLALVGKGTSLGRSYIGGFVGVNAGTIQNCWVNVDVTNYTDGEVFKYCGGFVGRNMGNIINCYSLGKVNGDVDFGEFVGSNEGEINNCFAYQKVVGKDESGNPIYSVFCGDRDIGGDHFFESLNQMTQYDYSEAFSSTYWELSIGNLPTLKTYLHSFYVDRLKVETEEKENTKGDTINLVTSIYPKELEKQYLDGVVYKCSDPSVTISGHSLVTSENSLDEIEVTAILDVNDRTLSYTLKIHLFDKPTDIIIVDDLPNYIEPGKRYRLNATVEPETAIQSVSWSLDKKVIGVSLDDNILTVTDMINKYKNNSFKVIATRGNISKSVELFINLPKYLESAYSLYEGEDYDLEINMPSSVNLDDVKVYRYNKLTTYRVDGQKIIIPREVLEQIPDVTLTFNVRLKDSSYYQVFATYFSHSRIIMDSLTEQYLTISSKEDLYKYFNFKDYDENRFVNYDKTFVLTNDIDLEGDLIYSVGVTQDEGEVTYDHSFKGKIYGFGHKIYNAKIEDNEKYFTLDESKQSSKFRSSKYNVGFFSKFDGEVYDLTFENIKVNGNNFCAIFAGSIGSNAYIENLSMINSKVSNIEEVDYSIPGENLKTGYLTSKNEGRYFGVTNNGATYNLIGE